MATRTLWYATVAGVLTVAVVGVGVALAPVASKTVPPQTQAPDLPLSQIRLDTINATRTPFCEDIDDEAITTAVGGSAQASSYSNGERTALEPGLTDVSHEFGCVFTRGLTVARVWLFAAPITRYDARMLVLETADDAGCTTTGPLQFGSPGIVQVCSDTEERMLRAVGRIGDAWVHCELSVPLIAADPRLSTRGQRWCVDAAYALDG